MPEPPPLPCAHAASQQNLTGNRLYCGDAAEVCAALDPAVLFDLVYLDPPFNVGGTFGARTARGETRGRVNRSTGKVAYDDAWGGLDNFLAMLEPRLAAIERRMRDGATLYLHLDHRTVHYAKVACDRVFGRRAFLGEIIWVPGNGARRARGPSVTHQTILVYARGAGREGDLRVEPVWNADDPMLREPYAPTSVAMHFQKRTADGRAYRDRTIGGKTYRYYADEGRRLGSVWTDAPAMVANTPIRDEGTGYPTQKPERLLERIVRASSRPGDVVADLMCGSGTTLVVAARLGRAFIGGDKSRLAIEVASRRLEQNRAPFELLELAPNPSQVDPG